MSILPKGMASAASVAALALLLVGCCSELADPLPADALEPNDTRSQATALSGTLEATMNEGDAADVFSLTIPAGTTTRIEITPVEGGLLAFEVAVAGPEAVIEGVPVVPSHTDFPITIEITPTTSGGTYFISLTGVYVGPPDAICWRGKLRYRIAAFPEETRSSARTPDRRP